MRDPNCRKPGSLIAMDYQAHRQRQAGATVMGQANHVKVHR